MYLLLASGYRKRYLDEIVRSLSLPTGALITLRYDERWLSPKAKQLVKNNVTGDRCLISFIHYNTNGPNLIPCRFGKIEEIENSGSFAVITIAVDKYASQYDKELFLRTIKQIATKIPTNSSEGYFFSDIKENASLDGVSSSCDEKYWEKTVFELKECEEFNKIKYNFFRLDGVYRQKNRWRKRSSCKFENGHFIVSSGASYFLKFSFYDTYSYEFDNQIVASSDNNINFYTPTTIPIDTAYDVRKASFKTQVVSFSTFGHININTNHGKSIGDEFSGIDFDLTLRIKGNILYNIIIGSIFGIFLFVANMKTINADSTSSIGTIKLLIEHNWIRFVLSLVAGLVASFGIKKPFW